ncbi:MAG: hypothetical protein ACFBSD_08250 [Paracoccaceae bacterium]
MTSRLSGISTRSLLANRNRAFRAIATGRNTDRAVALIGRIDGELAQRRDGRLDRAAGRFAPAWEGADQTSRGQLELFGPDPDAALRRVWRDLVDRQLPEAARRRNWPLTENHCFARVLLDAALGRPWREVVGPPAWAQMPADRLAIAVELGERVLSGRERLTRLDALSRAMRRERSRNAERTNGPTP